MDEVIHVEGGTIGLMVDFMMPTLNISLKPPNFYRTLLQVCGRSLEVRNYLNIIVCPDYTTENTPAIVWEGCALDPLIVHVSHQIEKFVVHLFRLLLSEYTGTRKYIQESITILTSRTSKKHLTVAAGYRVYFI